VVMAIECFFSESRMHRIYSTGLNGKSGGVQWTCTFFFQGAVENLKTVTSW